MMAAMVTVVEALRGRRVVVEFPAAGVGDWMAVCEVLVQEGIHAWAFALPDAATAAEALRIYGRRVRIGIHGVRTPQEVRDAAALGVHFITSPVANAELAEAASGTPLALGALTPNEVHHALGFGAPTVQVVPAEALGMAYARTLAELFTGVELLAGGRLEKFQCDIWLQAGASAVALAPAVLFGDGKADDLDGLRRRAREFGELG